MPADPNVWSQVLDKNGAMGLALIVLVVLLGFACGLIAVLVRQLVTDKRVPESVWAEECQSHTRTEAAIGILKDAVMELAWAVKSVTK